MSATIVRGEAESIKNFREMAGIANGMWNEHQEFAMNVLTSGNGSNVVEGCFQHHSMYINTILKHVFKHCTCDIIGVLFQHLSFLFHKST